MNVRSFIKDKALASILVLFAIVTSEIFLMPYPIATFIKIYIPVIILSMYLLGLGIEYMMKNSYYTKLTNLVEELEEKYFITEIIKAPNFVEGTILKNTLEEVDKSMVEHVNFYKYLRRRL